MNINRGDRFDFLVSVESKDFMMKVKAGELAKTDSFFKEFARMNYRGNMNVTIIKTVQGKTIMLQHDATSPSSYNMIYGISGTKGSALMEPPGPRISTGNHKWVPKKIFEEIKNKYTQEITKKFGAKEKDGGHGDADLKTDWRLIDCLPNGIPFEQDVYDVASWSVILPLTGWSVMNNSNSIKIPDFTVGTWKINKINMDEKVTDEKITTIFETVEDLRNKYIKDEASFVRA